MTTSGMVSHKKIWSLLYKILAPTEQVIPGKISREFGEIENWPGYTTLMKKSTRDNYRIHKGIEILIVIRDHLLVGTGIQ